MTSVLTPEKEIPWGWTHGEDDWDDTVGGRGMDEGLQRLSEIALSQWANRRSTTTGLTYGYHGGMIKTAGVWSFVASSTVALSDDATNFVERQDDGTVSANTVGFTDGRFPMAQVVTAAGAIVVIRDRRALASFISGVDWGDISGTPNTLAGYGITDAWTKLEADGRYSQLGHTHPWSDITGEPTTLAGYGITDAYTKAEADALFALIGHTHSFGSLTGKPTTLAGYGITDAAPLVHSHPWSQITATPTTLAGYGITDAYTKAQADALFFPLTGDLDDLANVDMTGKLDGDVPVWDAIAGKWVPGAGGGGGGAAALDDLTDVVLASTPYAAGKVLRADGDEYRAAYLGLADLGDVYDSLAGAAGKYLGWDVANSRWDARDLPVGDVVLNRDRVIEITMYAVGDIVEIPIKEAGTIIGWEIQSDKDSPSANAVVDVKRATNAGFPTFSSIAGTDKPTLTAQQRVVDATLTGWGNAVLAANDTLRFSWDSGSAVADHITVALTIRMSQSVTVNAPRKITYVRTFLDVNQVFEIPVKEGATISEVEIQADASGSATVTVERATNAGYPTFADLTGGADVTLSSQQRVRDGTLTGWTTAVVAGDTIRLTCTAFGVGLSRVTVCITTSIGSTSDLALDDLTDVAAPAPAVGETLVWNGTSWVSQATAGGGFADPLFFN